jgi:hypothetical protein
MAATCHAWIARVVAALPPPPELLMLLLTPNDVTRLVYILSANQTHHQYKDRAGVHNFSSYDGAYLFLTIQQNWHHRLLNLQTSEMQVLPDAYTSWAPNASLS